MLGYFGPAGTFTHQALRTVTEEEAVAFPSVREALDAVREGAVTRAVVPIENSVEGGVSATLDELIAGAPLAIKGEIVIPVEFGLYVREGTGMADVRQVLTHGHAAAQCREWLATNLPDAVVTEAGSTAGAAAEVARPDSRYDAAVCAQVAGRMYGLTELAYQIEDNPAR
ncbi:prephenate dehydratase domain-containing protein [Tessaracoccus coleopterorum]|uniref:prephenate dehydratase domain-containing protein n=1 Tax=Tessaracoccus coleopterorum TaxID=2714950 RepID=UPI002F90DBD9